MTEIIFSKNAPMVVLAHNHPSGVAIPSGADIDLTLDLFRAFQVLDITFLAHILVAGDTYVNILN
jgi:DNA repair protein RadC